MNLFNSMGKSLSSELVRLVALTPHATIFHAVIYVTAHRCADGLKKKFDLRSGSQRHRHFVGPVQAPTRGQPFNDYSETPAHFSRLLRRTWGHGGPILVLYTPGPQRGKFFVKRKGVYIHPFYFYSRM